MLKAEFVWDDLVMDQVCNGSSLLWAEMSSYRVYDVSQTKAVLKVERLILGIGCSPFTQEVEGSTPTEGTYPNDFLIQ